MMEEGGLPVVPAPMGDAGSLLDDPAPAAESATSEGAAPAAEEATEAQ